MFLKSGIFYSSSGSERIQHAVGFAIVAGTIAPSYCGNTAIGEELPKAIANIGKTKMKIAPYTKRWNEGETDWSFVENPSNQIKQDLHMASGETSI